MSIFGLSVAGASLILGCSLIRHSLGAPFTLAIVKINTHRAIMPKWHHYKYAEVRRFTDRLPNKEHMMVEEVLKMQTDMATDLATVGTSHVTTGLTVLALGSSEFCRSTGRVN